MMILLTNIVSMLLTLLNPIIYIFSKVMSLVLSIALAFGWVASPSTDTPITFKDKENLNMAFVAYADTQTLPTGFGPYYLDCGFDDIRNSGKNFDALVIAGDITEIGDRHTYKLIWKSIEKSTFADAPVLLATGNHDIRFGYKAKTKLIMNKSADYLDTEIDKPYYSYDVKGYTFIVLGSDAWQLEKAIISDEQLAFLDSELARATADGKPAFVVCHQPLANTHGLPEVWKTGDLGEDSEEVKALLMKYKNVFYLNGHLHDGVYEKSLEVFSEEHGVRSINLPSYGKENDYGEFRRSGLGVYVEVYDDEVVFTARDFRAGKPLEGCTRSFELV